MTDTVSEVQAAMREWQAVTDDLVAIVRAFEPGSLDLPSACGDWTNRQLLAHMATGYGVRIAVLQAVIDGTAASEIDADAANAGHVARLGGASADELVSEMMQVRGRVLTLLSRLRAEQLGVEARLGDGKPLNGLLSELNAHDLTHAAELRG